jgi:hypothetical protein
MRKMSAGWQQEMRIEVPGAASADEDVEALARRQELPQYAGIHC